MQQTERTEVSSFMTHWRLIPIALRCLCATGLVSCAWDEARDEPTCASKYPELATKVGKLITVSGRLGSGKVGYYIVGADGRLYLQPTSPEDISLLAVLSSKVGSRIEGQGVLHWVPTLFPGRNRGSPIPEHYYFDNRTTKVFISPCRRFSD